MESTRVTQLVDTTTLLDSCLQDISYPSSTKLAVDLEGVNLCRDGTISLLQVLSHTSQKTWVVDVTVLGALAFTHANTEGKTLKSVLEDVRIIKVFYDVRTDSDALVHLYNVQLTNVYDLQLLEVAVRRSNSKKVRFVMGLGKAIEQYVNPGFQWKRIKEEGAALLFPDRGGSYELFDKRPLDERVIRYAAQDVNLLFQLQNILEGRIGIQGIGWVGRVLSASLLRVNEARLPEYVDGKHRALASSF